MDGGGKYLDYELAQVGLPNGLKFEDDGLGRLIDKGTGMRYGNRGYSREIGVREIGVRAEFQCAATAGLPRIFLIAVTTPTTMPPVTMPTTALASISTSQPMPLAEAFHSRIR